MLTVLLAACPVFVQKRIAPCAGLSSAAGALHFTAVPGLPGGPFYPYRPAERKEALAHTVFLKTISSTLSEVTLTRTSLATAPRMDFPISS